MLLVICSGVRRSRRGSRPSWFPRLHVHRSGHNLRARWSSGGKAGLHHSDPDSHHAQRWYTGINTCNCLIHSHIVLFCFCTSYFSCGGKKIIFLSITPWLMYTIVCFLREILIFLYFVLLSSHRYHPSHPWFDRIHYRGSNLRWSSVAQSSDLPTHQRAALSISSHEVCHWWGHDQEGSQRRLKPAVRVLRHWQGPASHEGRRGWGGAHVRRSLVLGILGQVWEEFLNSELLQQEIRVRFPWHRLAVVEDLPQRDAQEDPSKHFGRVLSSWPTSVNKKI